MGPKFIRHRILHLKILQLKILQPACLLALALIVFSAEQIYAGPTAICNKSTAKKAAPMATKKVTPEEIKAGKMLFVKATCWGCHPHGDNSMNGDKPLKGPGFVRKYQSDEVLMATIRRGNVPKGMPPFPVEKLSDPDIKQIIVFIRSLSDTSVKP